jgi:hypothetical protein
VRVRVQHATEVRLQRVGKCLANHEREARCHCSIAAPPREKSDSWIDTRAERVTILPCGQMALMIDETTILQNEPNIPRLFKGLIAGR